MLRVVGWRYSIGFDDCPRDCGRPCCLRHRTLVQTTAFGCGTSGYRPRLGLCHAPSISGVSASSDMAARHPLGQSCRHHSFVDPSALKGVRFPRLAADCGQAAHDPLRTFCCYGTLRLMADFIAFELVPILAMFWFVGGGLVLAGVFALELVRRRRIGRLGNGELTRRGEADKSLAWTVGLALSLVVLGFALLTLVERATGPYLILTVLGSAVALGGIITLVEFWPRSRRRG